MSWVSERHLVAAISNAGGFGVIACGAMSPALLEAEIAGTQALTAEPFGVNLITMHPQLDDLVAGVSARRGRPYRAGGRHSGRAAGAGREGWRGQADLLRAGAGAGDAGWCGSGADALVIEGSEAGGHIGPVSLTVLAQEILPHLREVPVFVAGGLGRGEAILAYLEMGAAGAQLGTPLRGRHREHRAPELQAGVRARERARCGAVGAARRALPGDPGARPGQCRDRRASWQHQAETIAQFQAGELTREAAQLAIEHFWAGALRRAVIDGDVEQGRVMAGQSVGMVTSVQPTAEIIAELVAQAVAALAARTGL